MKNALEILGATNYKKLEDIEILYLTLKLKNKILNTDSIEDIKIKSEKQTELDNAFEIIKRDFNKIESHNIKELKNISLDFSDIDSEVINEANKIKIYQLVKNKIIKMQLRPNSVNFPDISNINFLKILDNIRVEGFFWSKNHINQIVKSNYNFYIDKKLNIIKTEFSENIINFNSKKQEKNNFSRLTNTRKIKKNKIPYYIVIILIIIIANIYSSKNSTDYNYVPQSVSTVDIIQNNRLLSLKQSMDFDNSNVRKLYTKLAGDSPGPFNIGQVLSIHYYLSKNWKYVNDPKGSEYFAKASESIENNLVGDCDDFAILMATCIKGIGGRSRITFASNNNSGHAYTEVYIGKDKNEATKIINDLMELETGLFNISSQKTTHYRVDQSTGEYWLNLDYSSNFPGGEYYKSTSEVVFDIENNRFYSNTTK